MRVVIGEKLYDHDFLAAQTVGFAELRRHVRPFSAGGAARAISCLPALTGNSGLPGRGMANIAETGAQRPARYISGQMSEVAAALEDRRIRVLVTAGSNNSSSNHRQ